MRHSCTHQSVLQSLRPIHLRNLPQVSFTACEVWRERTKTEILHCGFPLMNNSIIMMPAHHPGREQDSDALWWAQWLSEVLKDAHEQPPRRCWGKSPLDERETVGVDYTPRPACRRRRVKKKKKKRARVINGILKRSTKWKAHRTYWELKYAEN